MNLDRTLQAVAVVVGVGVLLVLSLLLKNDLEERHQYELQREAYAESIKECEKLKTSVGVGACRYGTWTALMELREAMRND